MAKNFRIVVDKREGQPTLELVGDIDGSSAAQVCYMIETLGLRGCTLDFFRVGAIDVFGARVLALGLRALRSRGVQFEVEYLPERVARTLCLGGVLEALV